MVDGSDGKRRAHGGSKAGKEHPNVDKGTKAQRDGAVADRDTTQVVTQCVTSVIRGVMW